MLIYSFTGAFYVLLPLAPFHLKNLLQVTPLITSIQRKRFTSDWLSYVWIIFFLFLLETLKIFQSFQACDDVPNDKLPLCNCICIWKFVYTPPPIGRGHCFSRVCLQEIPFIIITVVIIIITIVVVTIQ